MKIRNERDNSPVDELEIDYDHTSPTFEVKLKFESLQGGETLQLTLYSDGMKTQYTVTISPETSSGLILDPKRALSEDCDATNSVWNTIEDFEIVVSVVSGDFSIEVENFVETNGKDCQNLSIVADILFG